MNLLKKFFKIFLVAAIVLNLSNVTLAAPQEISAEGEYRLGDRDSRETAKMAALADAKRKIIEQVGVYVQSYSETNNLELTRDQVITAANSIVKIKHEEVHYYENGTLCRAFVVAAFNTENINPNPTPQPVNSIADKKTLQLLGIEEFKGHYYKVFNDGMNWQDAKKTCEDMGGHLVTITSILEQEIVKNLIVASGTKNFYWTGGFTANGTEWQWITGEKFSYSNWASVAPNGYDSSTGNLVENIVMLYRGSNIDGLWDDVNELGNNGGQWHYYDMENSGFVCEWENFEDIKI